MIDIVHAARVVDPHHAARLMAALGAETVRVDGWRPRTDVEVDRLLDAAIEGGESTITFERGRLGDEGFAAIDELAPAIDGYLDVNTRGASLRVWPRLAWMHGYRRLADEAVAAILGAPVRLADGVTTIDEVTFKLPSANGFVPFDVETRRVDVAARLFRALADAEVTRGFCTAVHGPTRAPLRRFLRAIAAEVEGSLELPLAAAAALAGAVGFAALQWDGPVRVTFPGGEISTYMRMPVAAEAEDAWRAAVSEALARG